MPVPPTLATFDTTNQIQVRTMPAERWTVLVNGNLAAFGSTPIAEQTRIKALRKFRDYNYMVGLILGPNTSSHPRTNLISLCLNEERSAITSRAVDSITIEGIAFINTRVGNVSPVELRFNTPYIIQEKIVPEPLPYPIYTGGSDNYETYSNLHSEYRARRRLIKHALDSYKRQFTNCFAAFDQYIERLIELGHIRVIQFRDLNATGPATTSVS